MDQELIPRSKFLTAATALDFVNQIIFSFVDHFLFDERKHQRTIYILEGGGLTGPEAPYRDYFSLKL